MMKALILAAGFGTRLRPYTDLLPKALFPVDGQPLLDRLIHMLVNAGCRAIAVNTHHLHEKIDAHIAARSYGIPVFTRYEPNLLGTGGAIKNFSDFWGSEPFLVVNADILTDIDFKSVYEFHCRHNAPATLVLVDAPALNTVTLDRDGRVSGFLSPSDPSFAKDEKTYTFTGIQVLDPRILSLIPKGVWYSSIDVYRQLIAEKTSPAAFIATSGKWQDLGTPERYKTAVRDAMAREALRDAFQRIPETPIEWHRLDGDGSDRIWYRLRAGGLSLVASDHGLKPAPGPSEIDSFVSIGRHLQNRGLPTPAIYRFDLFSGWVFMEDVGDVHLQTLVSKKKAPGAVAARYRSVLDILIRFSTIGIEGFDPAWTCQSTDYDRTLIRERECAYFVDAFLKGYLGLDVSASDFDPDFEELADGALAGAFTGLMHRDFQSRNILLHHGEPRIIDFQGARRGPIQYDIASLLIDPYAGLSEALQEELFGHAVARLSENFPFDPGLFRGCYEYCRITRNLQMLGAFGYLTRVKGKRHFEQYIPAALDTLKRNLAKMDCPDISRLKELVENL